MKNFHYRVQLALLLLFIAAMITSSFGQITPSQDSYTNTAASATNFGSAATLGVASGDASIQTAYIQFDLSAIPADYGATNVAKATLKLYVNRVTAAGSFNVDYVNGSWVEKTITTNLAPALGTTIASSVPLTAASSNNYLQIDVTSAVQEWLNKSQTNDGIALVANSGLAATFDSKENTTQSHPAELDIVFTDGGTISGVTTASGSGLQGGGTSGSLGLSLLQSCASKQVLQWTGSAWVCASTGAGTITGVTAGNGLTGGGTGGNVTLSLNPSALANLNAAYLGNVPAASFPVLFGPNTFTGLNTFHNTNFLGKGETATIGDMGCDSGSVGISFQANNCQQYALLDYKGSTILNRMPGRSMSFREGNGPDQMTIFPGGGVEIAASPKLYNEGQGIAATLWLENDDVGGADPTFQYLFLAQAITTTGNFCYIDLTANFDCESGIALAATLPDGRKVEIPAVASAESWVEDYGSGTLSVGVASVALEPTFALAVNTNIEYHVFLTPRGDCEGLYVTHQTATGFEVRELRGGRSNVAFDYKIVAKRKGKENVRLADITERVNRIKAYSAARAAARNATASKR